MEKIYVLLLALSVFTVHAAVIQNKDAVHKRVERSPCNSCDEHGPPFPLGPPGPPGPPPPPPPGIFQARHWSGFARHKHHHGIFSGASAAIGGGNQAGGEALSLASAVDEGKSANLGSGGYGGQSNDGNAGSFAQSSSSSQSSGSSGFGGDSSSNSQSAGSGDFGAQSAASSNAQSSNSFGGHSKEHAEKFGGSGSHIKDKYAYQDFQSSRRGNVDVIGHIQSQNGGRRLNSGRPRSSNSAGFSDGQQQTTGFVSSDQNSGRLVDGQKQFAGFSGSGQQSGGYGGEQQQSASFSSSQHQSGGYGSAGQQSNNLQHQAQGLESSGESASQSAGGYNSGASGTDKSHAALKGALDLASQGVEASGHSGCSTCGKNSFALSNAKSDSGNAVAVSVNG